MPFTDKPQVRFFTAKVDRWNNNPLGPVNVRTVEQLGLEGKARIGFTVKGGVRDKGGAVIYAKERAKSGGLKLAWDALLDRSKTRKHAADVALKRLEKRVRSLPEAAVTTEVVRSLNRVGQQLTTTGTVAAQDLQSLFDRISDAETTYAANQKQLQFNTRVKDAATQLNTPEGRSFIQGLRTLADEPFPQTTIDGFLGFIESTSALQLNAADPKPLDYGQAVAFARKWAAVTPRHQLGQPEDRYLIDMLAKLVLEACEPPIAHPEPPGPPEFSWIEEIDKGIKKEALRRGDGALFERDDNVKFGQGGNGSVKAYRCDAESIVVKELFQDETDPSRASKALAEARVHKQASQDAEHIVGIHGTVTTTDGRVLLVLQHAPNGESARVRENIDAAVEQRALTPEAARKAKMLMFADMLKGASEAHRNDVMHLDLKPENYFVDGEGRMLLGDFGTSRGVLADFGEPGIDSIDYTAPEINQPHRPTPITCKADVWSLGVMLYELFSPRERNEQFGATARRPFPYKVRFEGCERVDEFVKASPEGRAEQLELNLPGTNLHQLIIAMLDPNPLKRPSLQKVLEDPLIAPYASPSTPTHQDIVAAARKTILRHTPPAES